MDNFHERRALPEGWEWKKLGEISEIIMGQSPPGKSYTKEKNGIPLLNGAADFDSKEINPKQNTLESTKLSIRGDIIFCIRATIGNITFADKEYCLGRGVCAIRINDKKVIPKYISYLLEGKIEKLASISEGSTIKGIRRDDIKKLAFIIPPLQIQEQIVSILQIAEDTRGLRAQANELTDRLLQSVFLEMFGDPVKNPKGWEKKKLKCFGDIVTGNTPSRKNKSYYGNFIDWIKSDNINTPYTFLTKSDEMLSEEGAKVGRIVPKGSVLVTCIAGSLSCIGNVAIADREVAFNQQINAIIPNKNINTEFLYHLISNTKEYIQSFSTQSMKGMLSKGVFESIPFILPPLPLQQKFARVVEKVESMRQSQNQSKQQIEDLFSALMQTAFRGEI